MNYLLSIFFSAVLHVVTKPLKVGSVVNEIFKNKKPVEQLTSIITLKVIYNGLLKKKANRTIYENGSRPQTEL